MTGMVTGDRRVPVRHVYVHTEVLLRVLSYCTSFTKNIFFLPLDR